jgi:magnesium transporter
MAEDTPREARPRATTSPRRRRTLARVRPGSPPGALPPPDPGTTAARRITVIAYTPEAVTETEGKTLEEALAAAGPGVRWINVDGADAPMLQRLGAHFKLHPLALEDVLTGPQRPKVERYTDHFFMILRMLRISRSATHGRDEREGVRGAMSGPALEMDDEQVSIFFGRDWVITVQERPGGDVFDPVRDAIRQSRGRVREAGADYLAYLLLDAVVDGYFPVLEAVSDRVETLESETLAASPRTLEALQHTRHVVLTLRRAIWPTREAIGVLQREENPLIAAETRVFLRDSHDHAVQAMELIEALRETLAGMMDVYLSVQNQRLNEVMKVLTVIATIFIPLTFIASIYGMNFEHIPELHWRWGYGYALTLMAATAVGMLLYFRRKGWW